MKGRRDTITPPSSSLHGILKRSQTENETKDFINLFSANYFFSDTWNLRCRWSQVRRTTLGQKSSVCKVPPPVVIRSVATPLIVKSNTRGRTELRHQILTVPIFGPTDTQSLSLLPAPSFVRFRWDPFSATARVRLVVPTTRRPTPERACEPLRFVHAHR